MAIPGQSPLPDRFDAVVAEQNDAGYRSRYMPITLSDLPDRDVLVEVRYSSLNYKDALAVTGRGKIIRQSPMVLGIDLAGRVVSSGSSRFRPGDAVVVTGQGLSETEWGGYSPWQRVRAESLIPLPQAFSLAQAMGIGTAGVTAMLAVMALERYGLTPTNRPMIVTGAGGGVGSMAVALLTRLGYPVTAVTGRAALHEYLTQLGAREVLDRSDLAQPSPALGSERWAGGIDSVGGKTLAYLLAHTTAHGAVAACGLAGGADLPVTVFPFILRAVGLLGISSSSTPASTQIQVWRRLARDLPASVVDSISRVEPLSRIFELAEEILAGGVRGRVILDVRA